ncbi:hypothetical protein ACFQU3_02460 [Terrabacter sp. GCM10028922]
MNSENTERSADQGRNDLVWLIAWVLLDVIYRHRALESESC